MEQQLYTNLKVYIVLISEYNKNNTLVKGFILLWKDNLNPKYLRILNNVLFFLWNDEMILKMLFAMNEETISIDNETILFATCKKFIKQKANL